MVMTGAPIKEACSPLCSTRLTGNSWTTRPPAHRTVADTLTILAEFHRIAQHRFLVISVFQVDRCHQSTITDRAISMVSSARTAVE